MKPITLFLTLFCLIFVGLVLQSYIPEEIESRPFSLGKEDTTMALSTTKWKLARTSLEGRMTPTGSSRVFAFDFGDSTLRGMSFCNNFSCKYKATKKGKLKLFNFDITTKSCTKETMESEQEFFDNLRHVTEYKNDMGGSRLRFYVDKSVVALFNRVEDDDSTSIGANPKFLSK
jgi:heat shock protein HslJ